MTDGWQQLEAQRDRLKAEVRALEQKRCELNVEIGERDAEIERLREQIEVLVECLHQEGVSLADPWMQTPWTETTKDKPKPGEYCAVIHLPECEIHANGPCTCGANPESEKGND